MSLFVYETFSVGVHLSLRRVEDSLSEVNVSGRDLPSSVRAVLLAHHQNPVPVDDERTDAHFHERVAEHFPV